MRVVMTLKELLIQELDNIPDPLIVEVLDFLLFLKNKQSQDGQALAEARSSLISTAQTEAPANHPLQGKQPYHYEEPFAPAAPLEDWEALQ